MVEPKKNNPKSMDITPREETPPDTSSRPLIVSNRAAIADPMVVPDRPSSEPTTSPTLGNHERTIQPVSSSPEPDKPKSTPTPLPEKTPDTPQTDGAKTAPSEPVSPVPEQEPEPEPDHHAEQPAATEEPAPTSPVSDKTPSLVSKLDDKKSPAELATPEDEAEAKKTAEAEQAERIEELIENKTYFLPINQSKTRAGWVLFLLFLIVAAGGVVGYMTTVAHR